LDKKQLLSVNANKLHDASVGGPKYTSPNQSIQATKGYIGKLRWFHPAQCDTAVFMWLFMLNTGFNYASTLDMDVTDDKWCQPSLQHEHHCVIAVWKERVKKWVFRRKQSPN